MVRPVRIRYPITICCVLGQGGRGQVILGESPVLERLPKGTVTKLMIAWWLLENTMIKLRQILLVRVLCLLAVLSCVPLRTLAQPTNDNFSDATVLVGSAFAITADNSLATVEPTEPAHPPPAAGHTLWWTWTAPGDGWFEFQADAVSKPVEFDGIKSRDAHAVTLSLKLVR